MQAWVLEPHRGQVRLGRGRQYNFRGARGRTSWPMDGGVGLGAVGMWNFLWRLGFHPRETTAKALPEPGPDDVLFAQLDDESDELPLSSLRRWADAGGSLVVAGHPARCASVLDPGATWAHVAVEHPYAGLAYLNALGRPSLVAPQRWGFARVPPPAAASLTSHVGVVATVGGERQTPSRALLSTIPDAPAVVRCGRSCFLNANPFAAFQAWLQGQEDLLPWMAWRHRLRWLDEWVSDMASLLSSLEVMRLDEPRPGIAGLDRTTIVFRHDVDHSRDTAYLEDEETNGLGATHAVLLDGNTRFWVDRLAAGWRQECAFHYNTGRRDWLASASRVLRRQRTGVARADVGAVARTGLVRQVRRAKAAGIGIATLHRHLGFLQYPEWIDGLDAVFSAESGTLGGSSLFLSQVFRWGHDRVDWDVATIGDWPDAQFPLWLPFRIVHAADGGRALRGWESTSLMEPEPALVDQLLRHRIPFIEQQVFTFGFHPAHAAGSTFAPQGSLSGFREILRVANANGVSIRPLRDVYLRANEALAT